MTSFGVVGPRIWNKPPSAYIRRIERTLDIFSDICSIEAVFFGAGYK